MPAPLLEIACELIGAGTERRGSALSGQRDLGGGVRRDGDFREEFSCFEAGQASGAGILPAAFSGEL